jgi:short-subunit dehydrogenase involved in D-alanine esterification of teichoic acids
MPEPRLYLKGFGLIEGVRYGSFKLLSADAHHQKIQSGKYIYYTTLIFALNLQANIRLFKKELSKLLAKKHIIHTSYGNPYVCDFGQLIFSVTKSNVIVTAVGLCVRIAPR